MKSKRIIKKFICILTAVLFVSLTACENNSPSDGKTTTAASNSNSMESTAPLVTEEKTHSAANNYNIDTEPQNEPEPEPEPDPEPEPEPEPEPIYYHSAISGAVVTEQDGSPRFTYVKKCESCGKVQSGSCTDNAVGGVLNGSFLCSGCGKTQQFKIETTQN